MKTRPQQFSILQRFAVVLVMSVASFHMARAQSFDVLHAFSGPKEGIGPLSSMMQGSDDRLYGITNYGGAYNGGTLFTVLPDGTGFLVLHSFDASNYGGNPVGALIQGSDGRLYGVTYLGGVYGGGTIFAIEMDGSGFTILHDFDYSADGSSPYGGLMLGADGRLYGTTSTGGGAGYGTVFAISTDGSGFSVLHHFDYTNDGGVVAGRLVQGSGARLYGVCAYGGASGYGTVFTLMPDGSGFAVLHSFDYSGDGGTPITGLTLGSDSHLYGTTQYGGLDHSGTIFALSQDGTGFVVLHNFNYLDDGSNSWAELSEGADGRLYGTTFSGGASGGGTIYAVNPDGSDFSVLRHLSSTIDGSNPQGGLIEGADDRLYGTAIYGGAFGSGTVFAIKTDGSGFSVLHHFDSTSDGSFPEASLIEGLDNHLYGTTTRGGSGSAGTLFKMAPDGSGFTVLHYFDRDSDGHTPSGRLVQGVDGRLYGTTPYGGPKFAGTVYAIESDGSDFVVLHHFDSSTDGGFSLASLTQGADGRLYGTLNWGGINNGGTIFAIAPNGTGFTVLRHLSLSTDGGYPESSLIQGADGRLYGTTSKGGDHQAGTIFAISADGSGFAVLHHLKDDTDGTFAIAGLVQGSDGRLYGTAAHGGTYRAGTLFAIMPDGTGFTILHMFHPAREGGPYHRGDLIQGDDGYLFGTTPYGGTHGGGTIFRIRTDGSDFSVVHNLDRSGDGEGPLSGVTQCADGRIVGTASRGGTYGFGTIFALSFLPEITSPLVADGQLGEPFSYTITATNDPDDFDALGLPAGLTVNNSSGVISGSPSVFGGFDVTIAASNIFGTGTADLALTIVAPPPVITQQPQDTTAATGTNVSFSVMADSLIPLTYQWQKGGVDIPGATSRLLMIHKVTLADSGASYGVTVTNTTGNVTSSTATLTVTDLPVITAQPVSVTVPSGGKATFSVSATGTTPLSYQWKKNGIAIAGETASSLKFKKVSASDAGYFTVTVTNASGSVTSDPATLTVQ